MADLKIEPRCPGSPECDQHGGSDFADFDHYCDMAGVQPGEEGSAFAAWMNALTGWDGPMHAAPGDTEAGDPQ